MEEVIKKKVKSLFFPAIGREISVNRIDLPYPRSPYCRYVEEGYVIETYLSSDFHLPEFSYVVLLNFERDINTFDLQLLKSSVAERIRSCMLISSFDIRYIVVIVSRKGSYLVSNIHQEIRKGV